MFVSILWEKYSYAILLFLIIIICSFLAINSIVHTDNSQLEDIEYQENNDVIYILHNTTQE